MQLVGGSSSSPVSSRLIFGTDGTGWQFRIAKNQAGTISDLMTVLDSGKVGIGNITPAARFEISSSAANNLGGLLIRASGTSNYPVLLYENSGNGGELDLQNSANTTTVTVSSTGNSFFNGGRLGIGNTNPSYKLDVSDTIAAVARFNADSLGGGYITFSSSSFTYGYLGASYHLVGSGRPLELALRSDTNLLLTAGGSQLGVFITGSNGNVGINTTSPLYRLDVAGDTRIFNAALGVNVAPNATDGRIDASNDIVAYSSDKRLKTNIQSIKNPLDKIGKLSGFTYNWNDKANELANYDINESLVGVFAQEVQVVLPEAVKLAPFDNDGNNKSISGEDYLTVQYEKIVPLLIEAIKELKAEIDILKNK